jgi:hypothetical protein
MQIRAGGRTWVVDAHEVCEGSLAARSCWEVSFTEPERAFERVEMRWIPRPERLTENVARTLFELAGERLWRDPRNGLIYRIQLVDEGRPGDDADLSGGRMLVRFRTATGSGTTPYDLGCALGLAGDSALATLADRAFARIRGAPA